MTEMDNLKRLNEISSAVSERDLKIWENVAHSACIKKQTEMLKNEIARMKAATALQKKENKMIEEQLMELTKTLPIQRETLKASERSVVMQKAFKESLAQEANDFKKKYSETLDMYNDELNAYRSVYENASHGYKELKSMEVNLKKLEIKDMILDANISSAEKSQEMFMNIQKDIFHKTVVKFAQFYTLYHKRENVRTQLQEKKKEEQQLLKEHLKLAEAIKQKKRMQMPQVKPAPKEDVPQEAEKPKTEMIFDKLQKFLNEEILPCSLTSFTSSERQMNFNRDNSKVKILDMRKVRPPPPRPIPSKKPDVDLRKKMESIMEAAKTEARRTNSFQLSHLESQRSQAQGSGAKQKIPTPSGSQSGQKRSQSRPPSSQEVQKKAPHNLQSAPQNKPNTTPSGSQEKGPQKMDVDESAIKPLKIASQESNSVASGVAKFKPKDLGTSSILKSSQEKNEKQENVSKFFNPKRKSVTFQMQCKTETSQERKRLELFAKEGKVAESGSIVKNMDIFQKPFIFKNENLQKSEEKNKKGVTEVLPESETGTSLATGTNISFTGESAPTTFGTYGGDTNEKKNEMTFDLLETSFNRAFGHSTENETPPAQNTPFNFFSQTKSNPFSMF